MDPLSCQNWTRRTPSYRLRKLLKPFVCTPADHFPNSYLLLCPVQCRNLLVKTFCQPEVFKMCPLGTDDIMKNFQRYLPDWIRAEYPCGFSFQPSLSTACILPKPTRDFQKARPIVDYSHSWILRLGTALAIAILEICQPVFPQLLQPPDVRAILHVVQSIFSINPVDSEDLTLLQQDIAGFYNQVGHARIIASLQYVIGRYIEIQSCPHDQTLTVSMVKQERALRMFRGRWRSKAHQSRRIRLDHIIPLTSYLLSHSLFSIGYTAFKQIQGASMGSQWAPVLCAVVALHREYVYSQSVSSLLFNHQQLRSFRYVDNRVWIGLRSNRNIPIFCLSFGDWIFTLHQSCWKRSMDLMRWVSI